MEVGRHVHLCSDGKKREFAQGSEEQTYFRDIILMDLESFNP